jgi:hypothetical protein
MKETTETVERYGHKYEILHTVDSLKYHDIRVAKDGKFSGLIVFGWEKQYPQVMKDGRRAGEILTTWEKLNPNSFLCWAN